MMRITIKNISAILAALAVTAVTVQAEAPSLNYEISGNELIINYTGTLLQSSDAVTWSEVTSASSPYKVALGDKKQFFCAKGEEGPSKNITIPLSEDVELDMIWIEPGTFTMGSPEDELDRRDNEVQHEVTLTQGYWLGKYEVTQAQYKAVTGENPSHFSGGNNPVEMVNWEDAMAFCAKLTTAAKASGKLPEVYVLSTSRHKRQQSQQFLHSEVYFLLIILLDNQFHHNAHDDTLRHQRHVSCHLSLPQFVYQLKYGL